MPIAKKWSNFKKENVKEVPDIYGVYELANEAKSTVYIGEGKLRERLLAHFASGRNPIPGVSYFRYEMTKSKKRCIQRQNALLAECKRKYGQLPKFNQKSRS